MAVHSLTHHQPVIALLSDFGLQDQYVASMKGVLLSLLPQVQIVDLSHNVQPQNVQQAGYLLWSSYRCFPRKTIFVCVVDPDVGSDRKILAVKSSKYCFLAPDNGLLNLILAEENEIEIIALAPDKIKKFLSQNISNTFHGRDIFSPIAAAVAKGVPIRKLGKVQSIPSIKNVFVEHKKEATTASILHIDHFGNIITNIRMTEPQKEIRFMSMKNHNITKWVKTYSDMPEDTPCMLIGSTGLVEISIKGDNAAEKYSISLPSTIKIHWK